jgi:molecular chaperone DnaK (HSP70)
MRRARRIGARIGIDLGTTNTVVALADRGNYPVLDLSGGGDARLWSPTVLAWKGAELRVGWDALEVWDEPGWDLLGSPKRWLGVPEPELAGGPGAGGRLEALLQHYFRRLREKVMACPHLEGEKEFQAMLGVPANANSLQRLRTLRAAEAAGFQVFGLLHEPTAAAIEYAHGHGRFGKGAEPRHVLVYDLGGGTFDAALVRSDAGGLSVVRSAGIERLGGDDFDQAMAELAVERAGARWDDLPWNLRHRLLLRCREAKESLRATTQKWTLDLEPLGLGEAGIYREEFFERCLPLIDQTAAVLEEVLAPSGLELEEIDALLLVGGASQLPLVRRRLRELVGARLKISPHPFASTAVGLAIHAAQAEMRPVEERFSRHFGVWREAEGGARAVFDPIFVRETCLPPAGRKLVVTRVYHPAHNVGHFHFEECAALGRDGTPGGVRTPWCTVLFPFDPAIPGSVPLEHIPVERTDRFAALETEERYECDSRGLITVTLRRPEPPLTRSYLLHGPERVALADR